jgi:hypothetical protein
MGQILVSLIWRRKRQSQKYREEQIIFQAIEYPNGMINCCCNKLKPINRVSRSGAGKGNRLLTN